MADLVGVTPSAVSMALRGNPRIGKETAARIQTAARDLGYVTNTAGRALRAQKSGSIALVVPNTSQHVFGHAYFMHLLVGVSAISDEQGAPVIISTGAEQEHGVTAYERLLRSQVADGAIVASAAADDRDLESLVRSGLPVVLIGRTPTLPGSIWVGIDDVKAARTATSHLLETHHVRRIAHISGPLDHQSSLDRLEGCRAALRASAQPEPIVVQGDYSEESGAKAARMLLALDESFDAIFAANDEMAYGAMCELRRRGHRTPQDVKIVGFDDFGLARVTTPGITTIRVPAEKIGRHAAAQLFELLAGNQPTPAGTTLPVELIVRESCGCTVPDQNAK
ncbi:LacI family DNA-binding transcriptional regulator [Pengzhenrongella phosphoraccumulans]|uniref:LacI family DNA-binding transcriptional regulator n=1 Tax=Pengzhenrongella phosphoraccumulans TaxID=3114394 RepID=UPI00389071E6